MKTASLIIGIIQLVRLLNVDGDIIDLDNETIDPKSLGTSDAMFMAKPRKIKSTYDSRPPHPTDVAIQKQFDIYEVRLWGNRPYPEFDDALWQLFMASKSENMDYKKKALDKFLKYDKERKDMSILLREKTIIFTKQFIKEKNARCKTDLKSILQQLERTQRQTLAVKRAAINRKPICKF